VAGTAGNALAPRTWIFQANPNKYRILKSLESEVEEYWNLNQHAKDVHIGDRVLIWISGPDAGIYAVGTVTTEPVMMPDSPSGLEYWLLMREGRRPKPRVLVRYDRKLLGRPLLKALIRNDPELWDLEILHFPRGTNFPLADHQWSAIAAWLDDSPVDDTRKKA